MMPRTQIATRIARIVASGGGLGYAPRSPGTVGSLGAVALWWLLSHCFPLTRLPVWLFFITGATIVGYLATRRAMRESDSKDPQWIVIDEWIGQWLALAALPEPSSIGGLLLAFAFFRFFDISKIGPVGWAEQCPGALGVMLDDIVAGLLAAFCVRATAELVLGLG